MFYIELFIYYIIAVNIITFIVYGVDKLKACANERRANSFAIPSAAKARPKVKAKKGWWRIPEATLLTLAAIGGSIGAWCGMMLFRHKTKHLKFKIGVPLIFILQFALLVYVYVKY